MYQREFFVFFLCFISITQAIESFISMNELGTEFDPIDENTILLGIYFFSNNQECIYACHLNYFCRVFDYDSVSYRCRLFEGDLETTGCIIISNSSTSLVGQIELDPNLFSAYGHPCSACLDSRYLTCANSTCSCFQHTYWTGSMCASQNLRGGQCSNSSQCRVDLNNTCLQFFQCGPASLLVGTTIFGKTNGTAGSSTSSLNTPWGIAVNIDNSILIADAFNNRIILAHQNSSIGIIVAGGSQLNRPSKAMFDVDIPPNLYVLESGGCRMMVWLNNSTNGTFVFGSPGSNLNQLQAPAAFYLDSNQSFYIADQLNNRIVRWSQNASSGILIAGTSTISGNDAFHLNVPTDVFVDEKLGQMYVADYNNHRIIRYTLGSLNGTVVAGGNGPGIQRNQLNGPIGVWVSKKTGALCIADKNNHRIQRWNVGDSQGVTIAGSPNGTFGTSNFLFHTPNAVALNAEETYLFVCDRDNHRIQTFELI